eukprot:CAMPEP_0179040396 /NCGR_PEP_ID=MMETSP0796-20121207/15627_1 /TAXON_ID=73915 /ORGANISM="Pyrodinium bahamense, Strain pbaha01" /LENGTH=46 /DNA_ID= /DNA_START= /DNA_END= /DNA_ORIENTATION=
MWPQGPKLVRVIEAPDHDCPGIRTMPVTPVGKNDREDMTSLERSLR